MWAWLIKESYRKERDRRLDQTEGREALYRQVIPKRSSLPTSTWPTASWQCSIWAIWPVAEPGGMFPIKWGQTQGQGAWTRETALLRVPWLARFLMMLSYMQRCQFLCCHPNQATPPILPVPVFSRWGYLTCVWPAAKSSHRIFEK